MGKARLLGFFVLLISMVLVIEPPAHAWVSAGFSYGDLGEHRWRSCRTAYRYPYREHRWAREYVTYYPFPRYSYVVRPIPVVIDPPVTYVSSSPYTFVSNSYVGSDDVTVNVPNANGGYTAISLKRRGTGYIGPQGEFYSEFPRISQLTVMYGK